ncbi:hypothetical protein ABI59_13545 [Acidobacteria bacterium Mor1]|nr:hypothetical protein ABI59_13545 [Acidobacteria bacterium Mor1]
MKYLMGTSCLLILACLAAVAVAVADEGSRAEARAWNVVERMGLEGEEAEDVVAVLLVGYERQTQIVGSYVDSEDPRADREMGREIRESNQRTRELLEPLLTEDQLAAFDQAMRDQQNEAAGVRAVKRLEERLSLTPDQVTELIPIFTESNAKRRELMDGMRSSSGGGRPGMGAMRGMRDKMRKLDEALDEQLKTILDEDQMKEFDAFREEQREQMRGRMRGGRGGRGPGGR